MMMFKQVDTSHNDTETTTTDSSNSTTSTLTMETLMSTIKDLKKEVSSLKSAKSSTNPDINTRTCRVWKCYCWTHGCCPRGSKICDNKAKNHQDNATFKNRMGGNNKNCLGNGWSPGETGFYKWLNIYLNILSETLNI